MSDIFKRIRKEVGLNTFNNISNVDALAFFINNFANNPNFKVESYRARTKIIMIRLELIIFDIHFGVGIKWLFYHSIYPIYSFLKLLVRYTIMIPIGRLILKINPNVKVYFDDLQAKLEKAKEG